MAELPPFPVDDTTLGLLDVALNTNGEADRSSVTEFLELCSHLAGADTTAVESDDLGITVMRDAEYGPNDIIAALTAEVRRLRGLQGPGAHVYLSTGCLHGEHDYCASMTGLGGAKRPAECKFCGAHCCCGCHHEDAAAG